MVLEVRLPISAQNQKQLQGHLSPSNSGITSRSTQLANELGDASLILQTQYNALSCMPALQGME